MILTYYESVRGGVNNLAVALDTATGESSASLKGKDQATKTLKRKINRNNRKEAANA